MSLATTAIWTDANGNTQLRVVRTNATSASILTQMMAYSNAVITEGWEGTDIYSGLSPGTGNYLSGKQLAVLSFTDGSGSIARLIIPSPQATIFNSDGVTVSALSIGPLIAACVGTLLTAAGNPVTAFVGGELIQGRIYGSTS